MIYNILAFWTPGPIELLIILIYLGLPIYLIVKFYKLFSQNKSENVRLRLEVGKLADELEQMRKQKGNEDNNSSDKSG
ncbi:MAG: hypothetical protein GY845_26685 [Planctomycetes bacterium]|nr:hypothetical protein [Planctomycetota bacterium]